MEAASCSHVATPPSSFWGTFCSSLSAFRALYPSLTAHYSLTHTETAHERIFYPFVNAASLRASVQEVGICASRLALNAQFTMDHRQDFFKYKWRKEQPGVVPPIQ